MLKLNQIQAIHQGIKSDLDSMRNVLDELNAEIMRIKSDGTRHDAYIRDKVEAARKVVIPTLDHKIGTFGERLEKVRGQRRFWNSKQFLLSLQTFDADPLKDATIRLAKGHEFAAMDSALLQLVADSSKDDKNLPLLWQALLAGLNRNGQPGWRGIDLEDVAIPEQAEAIRLIRECEGLAMQASNIVTQASGRDLTPVRRLQTARATT